MSPAAAKPPTCLEEMHRRGQEYRLKLAELGICCELVDITPSGRVVVICNSHPDLERLIELARRGLAHPPVTRDPPELACTWDPLDPKTEGLGFSPTCGCRTCRAATSHHG